jgi:hypothetical protein
VGTGGSAQGSAGVIGTGGPTGDGVIGTGGGGAAGVAGSGGPDNGTGVVGGGAGTGDGVRGTATAGNGVHGQATTAAGVGVLAENTAGGTALQASGSASFAGTTTFSRSGLLTIAAGSSSATQTGVTLTPTSLVLATLQQDRAGVWVRSAVPNIAKSSFTVHLSKAPSASTSVAWFIVN